MTTDEHPRVANAPGLVWRKRRKGWIAEWSCRSDIRRRGYPKRSETIAHIPLTISPAEAAYISDRCNELQSEMLVWARGGVSEEVKYDGTIRSLVLSYQNDPISPYQKVRYYTRLNYDSLCKRLVADCGSYMIRDIKARQIKLWHASWTESGAAMAHSLVAMLRSLMTFGTTILECDECTRVGVILHGLKFAMVEPRKEALTADQANMIRAKAHEMGFPSIALAQAFQFECTLRQKDVIGEWVPETEPGPADITDKGTKWFRGLRWQEIDAKMILRHRTSKKNKDVEVNLHHAPMVMEELGLLPQPLPASGPVIVSETSNLPWREHDFRRKWRKIARACGIPDHVLNMDSRAGAITEATNSGAPLEDVRHAATHSNISMTQRYSRDAAQKIENVMKLRVASRNKNGSGT